MDGDRFAPVAGYTAGELANRSLGLAGWGFDTLGGLAALGQIYGLMLQFHDDLRDALERPANPDWRYGRFTLPIL